MASSIKLLLKLQIESQGILTALDDCNLTHLEIRKDRLRKVLAEVDAHIIAVESWARPKPVGPVLNNAKNKWKPGWRGFLEFLGIIKV